MITFKDQGHKYYKKDVEYSSVSKFFGKFQDKFDAKRQSIISSSYKNHNKLINGIMYGNKGDLKKSVNTLRERVSSKEWKDIVMKSRELRKEWKKKGTDASSSGTKFHSLQEQNDYKNGGRVNPWTGEFFPITLVPALDYDNYMLMEDLYNLPDGYYPELLIGSEELKIAGQADMVFIKTKGNSRFIDINDWKTDKEITTEGYPNRFNNGKCKRLLEPLSHLHDCKTNIYCVKISMYAYLLSLYGFVPRNLGFTHVNIDSEYNITDSKMYNCMYRKTEIEEMLLSLRKH